MVHSISQDAFEAEVLKAEQPVLVDFFATWCGPCKRMAPILDQLSGSEYGERVKFVKVDVDEAPQLSAEHGIMSVPTLMIFKNGEQVYKQPGLQGPDQLKELLDRFI